MPEDTKVAKIDTFKPEHKFDFKGRSKSIPILTSKVTRGANAGRIVQGPDLDKIPYEDNALIFNTDDLQEEIIIPGLRKLLLAIDKHLVLKYSDKEKDAKGNDVPVPGTLDQESYAKDFQELFTKLTMSSESIRALKLKKADLLKALMETDPSDMEAFRNIALQVQAIERQINESTSKDEAPEAIAA